MLAKLVKFVLLTRFSKPLLGLVTFSLAYDVVIRTVTTGNSPEFSGGFSYYAVGASIFFIAVSLLFGGLFVLKSDRDYLLTLPLKRRELSLSLFTAQFVGSGITILFLFGFYLAGAGTLQTTIVLGADLAILAAVVTALGVVSNILSTRVRAGVAAILGVWCLSSILGNPFTPVSPFTGDLLYGSITLFGFAAVTVPVALRELAYLELGSMRSLLRATSSEYKKTMSFAGKSPVRAVSTLAITGPFAVANIVLAFRGVPVAVNSSIVLLVTVSSASILATYLVARLGAVQQVKEEGMMPGQFDLKQLLAIIPTYIVIILIVVSEISLTASIIIAGVLGILSLLMMLIKGVWRGIAYRLTERGFV